MHGRYLQFTCLMLQFIDVILTLLVLHSCIWRQLLFSALNFCPLGQCVSAGERRTKIKPQLMKNTPNWNRVIIL